MSIPLKRKTLITHLYPNFHDTDIFLSFQFPLFKIKPDNAQLCTGKIVAIPSKNIENRP